jgi:hypothetical protein
MLLGALLGAAAMLLGAAAAMSAAATVSAAASAINMAKFFCFEITHVDSPSCKIPESQPSGMHKSYAASYRAVQLKHC